MVSIKKDNRGELKEATGLRTRKTSIYTPGQNETFKISRSKFSTFMDCKRCFYLDRVKGLQEPSMPGWALNTTVDALLKKEFDYYRERKEPHPIFKEYKLNFIPYAHEDMDTWRNALSGGISYQDENTNLVLHGGIDDVWFNLDTKELVVTDYKAQSTSREVDKEYYLASQYHQGFTVSDTTYFMVCNGEKTPERFDAKMDFTITLVDYEANPSWLEEKIKEMKETLESNKTPERNPYCENCAYLEQGAKL